MFGEIIKLIPVCDSVKKLYGLCVRCKDGTKACFTKRLVENDEQVFIDHLNFKPCVGNVTLSRIKLIYLEFN